MPYSSAVEPAVAFVGTTAVLTLALDEDPDGRTWVQRVVSETGAVLLSAPGAVVVDEEGGRSIVFSLLIPSSLVPAGKTAVDLRCLVAEIADGKESYVVEPFPFLVRVGSL